MMKYKLLVIFMAITMVSCDSVKVMTEKDKSVDFKGYKSVKFYGWTDNSDQILRNFDKERIENAISMEFRKRGHKVVKEDNDLLVSLFVVSQSHIQKQSNTNITVGVSTGYGMGGYGYGGYYGYGPGWGWGTHYHTTLKVDKETMRTGTLVISVYDARNEVLVWEGVGMGTISDEGGKRQHEVNEIISKIMYKYPVRKIK
ncbi:DUF4136 domain-containing protein [Carboxylicivirga sp. N1Y90]|uniref:DUF4136 domain-containing protein n=1 Tax=Carboxylicivirga fragile TaxID=3417571 RepID=UPI003D34DCC8|nr:DUF4136 domain-containing protein [Marinilabiliaceae bacterium N1Y90]